ncbi:MAG: FAD-binding oxidoreductase [Gammaproteobacteria bacterium]|nr:FAD-binding oxidoreductase [Gammaproteobacteria bacterium]MDH4313679.1 FAD-binding oxidoreductase [Gammaproteobacteria bacterium]MDH5214604.1 FAD-binding oxidoreductase [Gammaproteobacteria bacterium]MDH5501704.1 FAD-binding oxidoreductase [Gammaproteobacteria bacterium]
MSHNIARDTVSQTWSKPVTAPESTPEQAQVVIIGAGIVGISTAWFLAKQGIKAVVCEKGHIAGEQSGRNWGWVRQQARDPREMPMIIESLKIWRGLEVEIGEDVGFAGGGCLFTARNDKDVEDFEAWLKVSREFGLDTRIISGKELDAQVHGGSQRWPAAIFTASDGRAEPHKATPAIARAAQRLGATVLTGCAVRGIETSSGRVSAVVTEHGSIRTSTVLCAAGAWSSMFCRSLGISLPQLKVRGTVARTAPADVVLNGALFDHKIGIRRRQDGGYTIAHGSVLDHGLTPSTLRYSLKFVKALMSEFSVLRLSIGSEFFEELRTPRRWPLDQPSPFEHKRVLDPEPNAKVLQEIRKNLDETFPELAGVEIVESWAGMVETTPDVVPVICEAESIPGFHIATGFSGHGFGIGPGAGKAIAGMLGGTDSGIDLSEFRLSRFFDGTPIRPYTTI